MDIDIPEDELRFRAEVRTFALEHLPAGVREKVLHGAKPNREEYIAWQRHLYEKGWMAPAWPAEYGGTGWSLAQRRAFYHELALCCAPEVIGFGVTMVGPVIYTFGNEEQKKRFLPDILASRTWWCQGFSEPNSGSDLASLKTRAEDRGDHYLINGQKTWTTLGMYADMMFCLARTSDEAKQQDGISFLLLDMNAPGVHRNPIETIDEGQSICEVFLTDVKVPKENLVGAEGRGWDYAKFLLGHERTAIARVGRSRMQFERARQMATQLSEGGRRLIDSPQLRLRLCELEGRLRALEMTELRILDANQSNRGIDGAVASMMKIEGSELCQQLTELLVDLNGRYSMVYEGRYTPSPLGGVSVQGVMGDHLFNRVATIYGGSNEVQKNVIAKSRL